MYSKLPILALASAAIAAPVSDSTSTPDISSLLGGSGLSGLTGILGGSGGSSGLSSLLGGAGGLGGLTSILGGLPIIGSLTGGLGLKAREIADLESFLDDVIQFEKRQNLGVGTSTGVDLSGLLGGSGSDGLLGIVDGLPLASGLVSGLGLKERQDSSDAGLGDLLDLSDIENLLAGLPVVGSALGGLTSGLNVRQDSSDSDILSSLLDELDNLPVVGSLLSGLTSNLGVRQDSSDSDLLDSLSNELGLGEVSSTFDSLPIAGSLLSSLNVRQDSSGSDLLGGLLGGLNLGGPSGLLSPVESLVGDLPIVGSLASGLTSDLNLRDVADVDSMLNAFGVSDISSDAEISNIFSELPILGELFPQN